MKKIYLFLLLLLGLGFPLAVSAEAVNPLDGINNDTVQFGLEARYRMEYRSSFDFDDASDVFHLSRVRLNANITPVENVRIFIQAQDARLYESNFKGPIRDALFEDRFDLRQGYIELKNIFELPLTVLVGRQELSYGEERLVGGFNWSNVAQSFDALRLRHENENFKVDIFAAQKVITEDDHFNERDHKDNFYGIYGTWTKIKNHVVDVYTFIRDTENARRFSRAEAPATMDEVTFGTRLKGSYEQGWDYQIEIAGQAGNYGSGDIEAFALISQVGYTFKECPTTPRLFFEYAHASGDDDPGDGDRGTFDNLYPTNHLYYGWADFVSLQNINDFEFGFDFKPIKNLKVICSLHLFYLDEEEDALYNAGRAPIRFDSTAKASSTVGQELDILAKYKFNNHLWGMLGYSHFFPGSFIEDTGSSQDPDFLYVQLKLKY